MTNALIARLRFAGAAMLLVGLVLPAAAAEIAGLTGPFLVVDLRAASDVATTATARNSDPARQMMAATLDVGASIKWSGKDCDARPDAGTGSASARVDMNLADIRALIGTDCRLNQSWIIDCRGRAISDIWSVLVVDDRVLVRRTVPNITWLVLEKPLTRDEGLRLEDGLKRAGFDPGSVDGTVDQTTRSSVAAFVRDRTVTGANIGIITRSVLDALVR